MKVCLILGTRPEIIKMAPVIKECEKQKLDYRVLHTGQHYDYKMDKIFFEELSLKPRMINLNIGSGSHAEVTGKMLIEIEKNLLEEKPNIILVEGDTNSVLAGALAAAKLHIKIGHIESGLRSYDKRMPEEHNRIVVDHISDYLFAPTNKEEKILLNEGIAKGIIFVTGNTIVDSVYQSLEIARKESKILEKLNIKSQEYFLVTAHRQENVDNKKHLSGIIEALKKLSEKYNIPIIYPIHPRTKKRIKEFNFEEIIDKIKNLKIIDPLGFLDLLMLEENAKLILTDSGGIQEEACTLKIPCVVMRKTSDRPESIEVGAAMLSWCDPKKIIDSVEIMLNKPRDWENSFGDGKASEKIINIIKKDLS